MPSLSFHRISDDVNADLSRKRKLKQKTPTNTKKTCSDHKPPSRSVIDELNARKHASTKKW
jgi:hypothetical protein